MILKQLVLENVGTFAGRHTIDLEPLHSDKPIVLIGGLNGAGKTTILEAIHLAFYGARAHAAAHRAGSYDRYLRQLIHDGVPDSEGAAIELTFRVHEEGVERTYWLRRSWKSTGKGVREYPIVFVDGKPHPGLTSTWNEQADNFLPHGIAGLFFFDGERIEALADMDKSREVLRSSLDALLGLDLVMRLHTDLAVLRRRHQTDLMPDDLRLSVQAREQRVTAFRKNEEVAATSVATARNHLEVVRRRFDTLTDEYRAQGGELLEQRELVEERVAMIRSQLDQCEDDIRSELADHSPLLQVAALLPDLKEQAERELAATRERLAAGAYAERDHVVLRLLENSEVGAQVRRDVEAFLASDREQRIARAAVAEIVGNGAAATVEFLNGPALPLARKRLESLTRKRTELLNSLEEAERALVAIPDPDAVAPIKRARDEAREEVIRADAVLDRATTQLEIARRAREKATTEYERILKRVAETTLDAEDSQRIVRHIERVRATLSDLRTEATRRHLQRISALILEALGLLLRKERLVTDVEIDPETCTVLLTGLDSKELPASALSAGERQLLAVALLWGLARASGQPLPVVIDTPLGRLDRSHREHLLDRYFPHASHQVILLSTDTEIDENAYGLLRPHISREYELVFDPRTNATHVTSGYFWKSG